MANYIYSTWEAMNFGTVEEDTNFIILDHDVQFRPDLETTGIVYTGQIKQGFGLQNLNEIFSEWFKPVNINFINGLQIDNKYRMNFYIYMTTSTWSDFTKDTVEVTYDWSYGGLGGGDLTDLSFPISNVLDYRQWFVYSIYGEKQMTLPVTINNTTVADTLNISQGVKYNYMNWLFSIGTLPGEFNFGYSYDYLVTSTPASMKPGTYYEMTLHNKKYIITRTCYNYCVYYMNQYGGWDSLLFQGKTIQQDNLSRLSYKKNYIAQSKEYNKVDYLTTIQETWQLNTSYISDANSDKMIHLLSSNNLYLHNLNTGNIIPINVTNSVCEHKTYKNQNNKLYAYTVEVAASQPKYRI